MANVTCNEGILPSDVLWTEYGMADERLVITIIGMILSALSFLSYSILHHKHENYFSEHFVDHDKDTGGKIAGRSTAVRRVIPKTREAQGMLRLGRLMIISSLVSMCAPELVFICALIEWLYRAYAYMCLYNLVVLQFGGMESMLTLKEKKGTLQQHKPNKIWAQPPCCCIWGPFFCWMESRIIHGKDMFWIYVLIFQFCVVAPCAQILTVIVSTGHVTSSRVATLALASTAISVVSLLLVVWAFKVLLGVAADGEWIVDQAIEKDAECLRLVAPQAQPEAEAEAEAGAEADHGTPVTHRAHASLKLKDNWMTLVAAMPALGLLVAGQIVAAVTPDGIAFENGDCLANPVLGVFYGNFVSIILQAIGAGLAWKAFPLSEETDAMLEYMASRKLEAQVFPKSFMDMVTKTYELNLNSRAIMKERDPSFDLENGITSSDGDAMTVAIINTMKKCTGSLSDAGTELTTVGVHLEEAKEGAESANKLSGNVPGNSD